MEARHVLVIIIAVAAAVLAGALYKYSEEGGWFVVLLIPFAALAAVLLDLLPPPSYEERRAARPLIKVLNDLVAGLPGTGESLEFRLRELLVRRVAARTGLPVAEAEARAHELVKDELLAKLLRGEVRLRSEREVLELLERIDRL